MLVGGKRRICPWNTWAPTDPDVQQNLNDFIASRRALKKAKTGADRVSLGRAGDALHSPERVKKMAAKIFKQFQGTSLNR